MHDEEQDVLAAELRSLLDVERAAPGLSDARREAIGARLMQTLKPAAGPRVTSKPSLPPPMRTTRPMAKGVARVWTERGLLVLGGGILGAALHAKLAKSSENVRSPEIATATSTQAPTAPLVFAPSAASTPLPSASGTVALPAAAPAVPSASYRSFVHSAPSASTASAVAAPVGSDTAAEEAPYASSLSQELALVEQARAAVARRDGLSALVALRDHARKFPQPMLAEESDALEVQALAQVGRAEDARRRAAAFDAHFPQSIFRARVDATIAQLLSPPSP